MPEKEICCPSVGDGFSHRGSSDIRPSTVDKYRYRTKRQYEGQTSFDNSGRVSVLFSINTLVIRNEIERRLMCHFWPMTPLAHSFLTPLRVLSQCEVCHGRGAQNVNARTNCTCSALGTSYFGCTHIFACTLFDLHLGHGGELQVMLKPHAACILTHARERGVVCVLHTPSAHMVGFFVESFVTAAIR